MLDPLYELVRQVASTRGNRKIHIKPEHASPRSQSLDLKERGSH